MSDSNQTPSKQSKVLEFLSDYWLIILMFILIVVAFGFAYYVVTIYQHTLQTVAPTSTDRAAWGTTGDFFGGVLNPIFAFLGLIMLLATLFQSQRELSLTRKELELSRKAAEESEKALADQALTQKQQRFESTFFALLEQHNKLAQQFDNLNRCNLNVLNIDNIESAKDFLEYDLPNQNNMKRYFMVLYQLLKIIYQEFNPHDFYIEDADDYTEISFAEENYSSLVKAFISNDAGILVLFNCLRAPNLEYEGHPKFKALIERYSLFEHIKLSDKININLLEYIINHEIYSDRAFKDNFTYNQLIN